MALQETIQNDDWRDIRIPSLGAGLNLFLTADNIEQNELSRAENIRYKGDKIIDPFGYSKYRDDVAILGTPMDVIKLDLRNGSSTSLLATTLTMFRDTGTQWQLVDDGSGTTTLDANEALGQTILSVTATTGFTNGDPIAIQLNTGAYHHSTIASFVSNDTVTINDALPSAADSANIVYVGVQFTGTDDNIFSMVSIPWSDQIYIANGIDQNQLFSGSTNTIAAGTNPSGITTFVSKVVALFDGSLWAMNTTEDSTRFPQRARRTEIGDLTDWDAGNAGFTDLYEGTAPITSAGKLGPYLIIYRAKGIHRVAISSSASKRFDIDQMISDEGTLSAGGHCQLADNEHLVWGLKNFYRYKGGFGLTPVGDKVANRIFGEDGTADKTEVHKQRLLVLEDFDEILAVYQGASDTDVTSGFIWRPADERWATRNFTDPVRGATKISGSTAITWNAATGTWDSQSATWDSSFLSTGSPSLVFASDTNTYQITSSSSDDDGATVTRTIETKDFSEYPLNARLDFIEFKAAGGTVTVQYSVDEGISWQSYESGSVSASSDPAQFRMYQQIIYESIRFRFQSTDDNFEIHSLTLRVAPESEH